MISNIQTPLSPVQAGPTAETWYSYPAQRDFVGMYDHVFLYLSIVLLVLSTIDSGSLGSLVKMCWLGTVALLAATNVGGAFAMYIGSLAIYSPLHFDSWGSPWQRPDNYALIIVFAGLAMRVLSSAEHRPRISRQALVFLAFLVVHSGLTAGFSKMQFASLLRDIVIPLASCELLAQIRLGRKELDAFQNGMAAVGAYAGWVSILERVPAYDWILPPWVGDLSLRPYDEFLIGWRDSGRSGGTLLQPAWNGLFLGMVVVILILALHRRGKWPTVVAMLSCAAGSFLTYTRGVWLGLILALMWFPGWCSSPRQARLRRIALVLIAGVLIAAASGMADERLHDSGTVYYRFNLWGAALRLAVQHPVLGVGFFNFGSALTSTEQGFGSLLPSIRDIEGGVASHNTLLTVLVEFGTLGLLIYGAWFYKTLEKAKKNAVSLWGPSGASWIVAFVIVYLVNAQFVSAFEGTTNVLFFGFLGIISGARPENS